MQTMSSKTPADTAPRSVFRRLMSVFLTLAFPVLCVLLGVRLAMTEAFLRFEYLRPGFPADFYGFTTEDRLQYAPFALNYLLNGEPIDYLADLTFDSGGALFNARELHHMRDVKVVTQIAFLVGMGLAATSLIVAVYLWRQDRTKLLTGLRRGAIFSLSMIGAIILLAIINWDFFFTTFHQLFFEDGTWMFLYSDTLIRLFPEQFWFDAAIWIGGLTSLISALTLIVTSIMRFKGRLIRPVSFDSERT